MNSVKLMNRIDTKFVFNKILLCEILPILKEKYRVLKVSGARYSKYASVYFDTPDFLFYHSHHNGRINRVKIRFREYINSGLCFLEIKKKDAKGKTIKSRVNVPKSSRALSKSHHRFIKQKLEKDYELSYCHENFFNRITLVNKVMKERLTIDFNFRFKNHPNKIIDDAKKIVIAELKQERLNRDSFFYDIMRKNRIRKTGMSKYCFATSTIFPDLKSNRFKPNFAILEKNNN
tara:strand:+ start:313 stop:1011 length:699 start_codon:yes stop_codon:yes gene_type:complete